MGLAPEKASPPAKANPFPKPGDPPPPYAYSAAYLEPDPAALGWPFVDGTEGLPQPGTWRGRRYRDPRAATPVSLAAAGLQADGLTPIPLRYEPTQRHPAALGKYARTCSGPNATQEDADRVLKRSDGYKTRRALADRLRPWTNRRPGRCGRVRIASTVQVQRGLDGHVRTAGVETCGSVWACPLCAVAIYAERAEEVRKMQVHCPHFRGYLLTLTIRHDSGLPLSKLLDGLTMAWARFWTDGRASVAMRRHDLRVRHYARGLEVTHGAHGWHPHFHVFLLSQGEIRGRIETDEEGKPHLVGSLRNELAQRWADCVKRELGPRCTPTVEIGLDLRPAKAADYIAKLGLEIANITSKAGNLGNRTPWAIAADACVGDLDSAVLWRTYVRATKGRRQISWSKGSKRTLGLPDLTDEQIVQQAARSPAEYRDVRGEDWDAVVRAGLLPELHAGAAMSLATIPGVVRDAYKELERRRGRHAPRELVDLELAEREAIRGEPRAR